MQGFILEPRNRRDRKVRIYYDEEALAVYVDKKDRWYITVNVVLRNPVKENKPK